MEPHQPPYWSLPLRLTPDVMSVGYSPMGITHIERYRPAACWQVGLFEGPTEVVIRRGRQQWRMNINPYDILLIPPDSERIYTTERPVQHYYLAFRYPADAPAAARVELPGRIPCGPSAAVMQRDFAACMDLRDSDRAESDLLARLILWRLVRLARMAAMGHESRAHLVERVQGMIREHTADPSLTSESLAEAVGYSRRRLDQLFVDCLGKPVSACIRDHRARLAEDLLRQTNLPVNLIGTQVGIPDPHGFNKFTRRNRGKSPSAIRRGASRA